ncbi:MAG: metallophosphoesterase [Bacteroidetes bacterium]|nr:metallophosphoesterase [Bacteroidota bacterium]
MYSVNRRKFIRQSAMSAGLLAVGQLPLDAFAKSTNKQELTILHTNDVHSRLDPFPMDGSKFQGMGGVLAREKIISSIRNETEQVLLLDSGDIFQGTPYFNKFQGKPEMQVMSMLKYDAATLGNHDFDNGIEGLANQLVHANFPFVNCNYDFTNTELENKIEPYTIIKKGKLKIGIFGVGIELQGLVPDKLFGNIQYHNPIENANKIAYFLKQKKRCDYIICLSHLGFEYKDNKVSDKILAKESEHIHLILGGHTHTFLDEPHKTKNRKNQEVIINQVGWAGIMLGRINIYFDNKEDYDYVSNFTAIEVKETSA